jgi:hypothetical protein
MCWIRDKVPNLKTKEVIVHCLIRAITHLMGPVKDMNGAIVE